VNPSIKLIYQVAELDIQSMEEFLKSDAARQIDILAIHPYAWPDFQSPETWMPQYISKVRALMAKYDAVKPIWFTEIGAPVDGNPGGFFGYPAQGNYVRGVGRAEYMGFMVKCHLIGFANGVEKVFWYNYWDAGVDSEYAERHFGIVDARSYPMPGYAAYCTMARMIRGKALKDVGVRDGDVQTYRFRGAKDDCLVVWSSPAAPRSVSLGALGLTRSDVESVTDIAGVPVSPVRDKLAISGTPLYIQVRR
jgi:hypothetical protein